MSCYSTGLPGAAKGIPMKRKHTGDLPIEKSRWWEQCQEWMLYYKCQCAPLVLDMKCFLHAFGARKGCSCWGWCRNGTLRKAVANKRGHLPVFFVWMLHGSTKVVVRAVALLSAKTKWKVANTLERFFPRKQQIRKHNETKPPTTMQSPGECREGWVKPVPRAVRSRASWQRREHACQPSEGEGNACSIGWKMLQILKRIKFCGYLRQVCSAGWTWWKVALSICECELRGVAWKDAKVKQWS